MSKPNIKITFANGSIGSVAASSDGVTGLVVTGAGVSGKMETGKAYVLNSLEGLTALGVTGNAGDANAYLWQVVKQYYAEAGRGSELWLMVVASSVSVADMVDEEKEYGKKLLKAAGGRVRTLMALSSAAAGVTTNGLDSGVWAAERKAQALCEWATESLYAPVVALIEGKGYANASAAELKDLGEGSDNRVGIVVGRVKESGSAVGSLVAVVAGRASAVPVHRHIGRVKDGALSIEEATIDGSIAIDEADIDTVNDKGYITLRSYTGKSGYYVCDDSLATSESDDYHSYARRRVADKAYRIAYAELIEKLLDEIPTTVAGCIIASMAKAWEGDVIGAVALEMTANGELSTDPEDSNDKGVECSVDTTQNVVSTGKVKVELRVKPYGYAKYIETSLGFSAVSV